MEKAWVKKTLFLFLALLTLTFILVPMTGADTRKSYYVALGDSLTVGYQAPGKDAETGGAGVGRKKFTELYFNQVKPYYSNLELINYGKIGVTSNQLRKEILNNRELREDLQKASVVTITIGGNDLLGQVLPILATGKTAQLEKGRRQLADNLAVILAEVRKLTQAPVYISDIYNPFNPKKWQYKKVEPWIKKYNQTIYDIAWRQGVGVAPVYETFQGHEYRKKDGFIGADSVHPNDAGYEALSEAFWRVTKNNLPVQEK